MDYLKSDNHTSSSWTSELLHSQLEEQPYTSWGHQPGCSRRPWWYSHPLSVFRKSSAYSRGARNIKIYIRQKTALCFFQSFPPCGLRCHSPPLGGTVSFQDHFFMPWRRCICISLGNILETANQSSFPMLCHCSLLYIRRGFEAARDICDLVFHGKGVTWLFTESRSESGSSCDLFSPWHFFGCPTSACYNGSTQSSWPPSERQQCRSKNIYGKLVSRMLPEDQVLMPFSKVSRGPEGKASWYSSVTQGTL